MTNFNVRIPGLAMTVVQADGCTVRPVETDEFQIAIAETYDVIVTPSEDRAYGVIAEAIDRSGLVRATLAPKAGMTGEVPKLRARPLLTMKDMGMDHSMPMELDLSKPEAPMMDHSAMNMRDFSVAPQVKKNAGVASLSPMPAERIGDAPTGLEDVDHRVLRYTDLKALTPHDAPAPTRTIQMHLTANMERYMWSFDGERMSERTAPIMFRQNERVRITLINDTMMPHPIHVHGHFFELVTGADAADQPLKHTVNVLPGGKLSIDMTADALGDWAMHCHMMFHMDTGMFRILKVRA
jgi:CopA family copper-resistance protein